MKNTTRFFRFTIEKKLLLLISNAIVGILAISFFLLYTEKEVVLKERQSSVQQAVETAYGVLEYYESRAAKNELSLQEAQRQAMNTIRGMRYSGSEYFWINDMKPTMLMHPIKPALDNTDIAENKDATGKQLFVDMVNTVKKDGAGFEWYRWPKPGSEAPVAKVSYIKGFAPWGWVIGSGVYIDTVEAMMWHRIKTVMLVVGVLGLALLVGGLWVARSVTHPIGIAVAVAQRVAQGDLTSDIQVQSNDEVGQLMQALKDMNENLVQIVTSVYDSTGTISTASSEIASGNFDLSSRTEQQASSLEETASAMEELTSTVRQNADNAHQANKLAQSASEVALRGGKAVAQVIETMDTINDSSKKIVDIIGVIDDIAFQTNILSLNAAVEAARAGEQGKGFAVVATEVRSLAQRSAMAAKEIKELINESVSNVNVGSKLVEKAGMTMQDVVGSVRQVTSIMADISAASQEQSTGIEQINHAISQMDQVTQQNAALVEQAAAAAASLQEQAQQLSKEVNVFTLLLE